MRTTVVDHPLAAERLTVLRDAATDRAGFRRALDDLAAMLLYEATREVEVEPVEVATPLALAPGVRLVRPPLVVPVLRAGLGMAEAARRLLPGAATAYVGVVRHEETFVATPYVATVPSGLDGRPALVLDPMLATGGSAEHTLSLLAERGIGPMTLVCVLAAPEGLSRLERTGLDVSVVTAAVDERLNERAFIVPGLGDAGDRQFGEG